MATTRSTVGLLGTVLIAGLLAPSCAPRSNQALERARAAYRQAEQDPDVTANAPVALHEARQALEQADRALDKGNDSKDVDTLAYVAQRKVEVAREVAAEKRAETEAERLARERDQVLLGARTGEARVAREEARAAEQELQQLRARETERGTVVTLSDVLFETNRAELKPGAIHDLDRLADALRREPERDVVIEGHTDNTGTPEYNRRLSQERADAVRDYLISRGVSPDRLLARGMGESLPVASNTTAEGRQQNRRVEVVIQPGSSTAGAGRQPRTPEPTPPY